MKIFTSSKYWFDLYAKVFVKNGDLSLLGDYRLVGLGTGFKVLPIS